MLIVIEMVMLLAGVWALVTAKIPSWVLGGKKYEVEGRGARLAGLFLILPLPMAFTGGIVLGLLAGNDANLYAAALEWLLVLGAGMAAVIVSRITRRPAPVESSDGTGNLRPVDDIEPVIARKANGALIYALLGLLGFSAILVCPLAFFRANQALGLIDKHQVGGQYRSVAGAARILAPAILGFYVAAAAAILVLGLAVL